MTPRYMAVLAIAGVLPPLVFIGLSLVQRHPHTNTNTVSIAGPVDRHEEAATPTPTSQWQYLQDDSGPYGPVTTAHPAPECMIYWRGKTNGPPVITVEGHPELSDWLTTHCKAVRI